MRARRNPNRIAPADFASSLEDLYRLTPLLKRDNRSLDEYLAEVDDWVSRLAKWGTGAWPVKYFASGHGRIRLRVENLTDSNLADVRAEAVFLGDDIKGLDEIPAAQRMPKSPRSYGDPESIDFLPSTVLRMPNIDLHRPVIPELRSTWVEDGSVRIVWSIGDLRPREVLGSDDVYILARDRRSDSKISGSWKATSKSTDGVLTGQLEIPQSADPTDVALLLDASVDDGWPGERRISRVFPKHVAAWRQSSLSALTNSTLHIPVASVRGAAGESSSELGGLQPCLFGRGLKPVSNEPS